MGIARQLVGTIIKEAAAALGITQTAAGRIAKDLGADVLQSGVKTFQNFLAGGRPSRAALAKLPPELVDHLNNVASGRGGGSPPRPPLAGAAADEPGGFRSRPTPPRGTDAKTRQPKTREEEEEDKGEWSDFFRTPTSSNTYGFRYFRPPGQKVGILEITYKAINFHAGSLTRGSRKHKGKDTLEHQLTGVLGGTVKGGHRPDSPGAVYQYLNIPPRLFTSLKDAWSKGKWVWSNLRIRGQIHGGRYPYVLVSGDIHLPSGGAYIPRRAVAAKGGGTAFRTRSLAEVGSGRRSFVTSTLPPSNSGGPGGFRTRSVPAKRGRR